MSFVANVFRVLIASPSDVQAEREAACEAIHEWNAVHSAEQEIFLEPVRWESHTVPELGDRPQEIVNRQVVDSCDILIGVFWTRMGTPTGISSSGTEEEIGRFLQSGMPVMLYFSEAPVNARTVDLSQYRRLERYRKKCLGIGIVDTYSDISAFKKKLGDHLSQKVTLLRGKDKDSLLFRDTGIRDATSMWAGTVDNTFILDQRHLSILLKDGHTFFGTRAETLRERFRRYHGSNRESGSTSILILHPEYQHMAAVADMDPQKKGHPEKQRADCLRAIRTMHGIREYLDSEGIPDIEKKVRFAGYRMVPAWNGFLGTTHAFIHLYHTAPYRGVLRTLRIPTKGRAGRAVEWYEEYLGDYAEIIRTAEEEDPGCNLWNYNLSG